ncbi:MAG TPA: asparagine synthase (glutamine-hydrolyzing) [Thermoanaerobaculia bacterium]|jgi:asparagine synthase (glutamine-hydrolysing)
MCGIAGHVNWADDALLARMTSIQSHRGPDDSGTWSAEFSGGRVGLGSRRLAILDLSPAGHMPMATPDGNIVIAYNGEVYNYPELRRELEGRGYTFRSNSDTEAILYLYELYGTDCFRRLDGMFGLAIWDKRHERLVLARDHFGIKPLYYTTQHGRLAFASELKAILELPGVERSMDPYALSQYLTFLWVPDPLTMLRGIVKLQAGHFAVFERGELRVERFWEPAYPAAGFSYPARSEQQLAAELRERFFGVVKRQMLSDVPVGAFLSAGLDSSSIVAAMAKASPIPVRTFTIAFPPHTTKGEVHLDDTAVAERTAKHFGCVHTQIVVEPDVVDLLPKLVWHMDEPVADPAIVMAYLVNREARKDVTVLLSGIGGDEVFAGYRKYQAHYLAERYRRIPRVLRESVIRPAVTALPSMRNSSLKGYVRLAKKMVRSGSLEPVDRFLMDSVYFTEEMRRELGVTDPADPRLAHLGHFARLPDADFLHRMLYVDLQTFMVSLNLTYNDKMSMASSVEVRVPFLDRELIEWTAWNVPPSMLMRGGTTKLLLREAMRGILPDEVLTQKKAGFGAPADHWLANDLREMVDDLLDERTIRARGLFNPAAVRRLIEEQRSGRNDWSLQLWQLLTLELWMREYMP